VFAFADSDGRVPAAWLRALVAALNEEGAGAATGYRWHLPQPVDFWSLLRSVWNAVIAGGMGPGARFCWGGAMAVRRETFERLDIPGWWKGAVSDDYRLSEAVRAAGMRIVFAPGAMVAAADHTGGAELLGWITRQMRITRFYAPVLWRLALAAHLVYCGSMVAAGWLAWEGSWMAGLALGWQLGTGMWKGWRRVENARGVMNGYEGWFRRWGWAHVVLVPLGTWLWLYGCAAAGLSDRIRWRGGEHGLKRLGASGTKP
jgi:GT2 family glycosyltransferase